jgi:DNA-3-methyladenine glycosylase II
MSSSCMAESEKVASMESMDAKLLSEALQHLRKDPDLGPVLRRFSLEPFGPRRDPFTALVRSIVYQQLSGKAAGTILARLLAYFPRKKPTPELMQKLTDAEFRAVGISGQKMGYLRDLAKRFEDGTIEPKKFPKMTDEEIREHLLIVKGIGRWTADMFLMFTLYRPDVLPTGDLGIQKGFQKVFRMRTLPDPKKMQKLARPWAPYRTVASLYLWRTVDGDAEGGW